MLGFLAKNLDVCYSVKKEGKGMEENKIELIRSKDNITLKELRETYLFAHRKSKIFITAFIIVFICSCSLLTMSFWHFSLADLLVAILLVLFLIFYDSIRALAAYRRIKRKNKCIRISFEEENIVVDNGIVRSEIKYSLLSNITKEEKGVFIILRKRVIYFFPNDEIESSLPVSDFLSFLQQKTGLTVESRRGERSDAAAFKAVAAVIVIAIIAAQFTFFSTPSKASFDGCTVELNKSYREYEEDSDWYSVSSSYEKLQVNIYNYRLDEFSDVYECGGIGSIYQIVEVFAQDIQARYDGERLERNGEWLSSLPNGMKTLKMKYTVENEDVYGVFCLKAVGEKVYIIEFLSEKDFSKIQNDKIDKYISTIQTA